MSSNSVDGVAAAVAYSSSQTNDEDEDKELEAQRVATAECAAGEKGRDDHLAAVEHDVGWWLDVDELDIELDFCFLRAFAAFVEVG